MSKLYGPELLGFGDFFNDGFHVGAPKALSKPAPLPPKGSVSIPKPAHNPDIEKHGKLLAHASTVAAKTAKVVADNARILATKPAAATASPLAGKKVHLGAAVRAQMPPKAQAAVDKHNAAVAAEERARTQMQKATLAAHSAVGDLAKKMVNQRNVARHLRTPKSPAAHVGAAVVQAFRDYYTAVGATPDPARPGCLTDGSVDPAIALIGVAEEEDAAAYLRPEDFLGVPEGSEIGSTEAADREGVEIGSTEAADRGGSEIGYGSDGPYSMDGGFEIGVDAAGRSPGDPGYDASTDPSATSATTPPASGGTRAAPDPNNPGFLTDGSIDPNYAGDSPAATAQDTGATLPPPPPWDAPIADLTVLGGIMYDGSRGTPDGFVLSSGFASRATDHHVEPQTAQIDGDEHYGYVFGKYDLELPKNGGIRWGSNLASGVWNHVHGRFHLGDSGWWGTVPAAEAFNSSQHSSPRGVPYGPLVGNPVLKDFLAMRVDMNGKMGWLPQEAPDWLTYPIKQAAALTAQATAKAAAAAAAAQQQQQAQQAAAAQAAQAAQDAQNALAESQAQSQANVQAMQAQGQSAQDQAAAEAQAQQALVQQAQAQIAQQQLETQQQKQAGELLFQQAQAQQQYAAQHPELFYGPSGDDSGGDQGDQGYADDSGGDQGGGDAGYADDSGGDYSEQ